MNDSNRKTSRLRASGRVPSQKAETRRLYSHVGPFLVFALFLGVTALCRWWAGPEGPAWLQHAELWVYPVQTLVCAWMIWHYWKCYRGMRPAQWGFTLGVGILVLLIWLAPQYLFGLPARYDGFDPTLLQATPLLFFLTLGLRFLRLVVVVPILEEVFWRGFLMRYLIDDQFWRVRFGTFSWMSFLVVTLLFGLAHYPDDFYAALVTGALYNYVAIRTKSLGSCILAHALTNLLLGIYIVWSGQWGYW